MTCFVPGCTSAKGTYSPWCRHHRTVNRRRGHPEQLPLKETAIATYELIARERLKGDQAEHFFALMREVWTDFARHARDELARYNAGQATARPDREAAIEVIGVNDTATADDILVRLLAVFLFREDHPRHFKSDDAFAVILQRAVRKKSSGGYDMVWNATRNAYAQKLRGLRQLTALTLGRWLVTVFGPSAGMFAQAVNAADHRRLERQRQLTHAVMGLSEEWRTGMKSEIET